jgi:hypothetical protein
VAKNDDLCSGLRNSEFYATFSQALCCVRLHRKYVRYRGNFLLDIKE